MKTNIRPIPIYNDNYVWVLDNGTDAVVVDPGLAEPVNQFLSEQKLNLTAILITHHHWDHVNGLEELKEQWQCEIYSPYDNRIPAIQNIVSESDVVQLNSLSLNLKVMETPGHTLTHVCYYNDEMLFCGDTLFSMGCGRMFEGTPDQYVNSLNKIKALPESIMIYCTHEYTLSNIAFAEFINPNDPTIIRKKTWAEDKRKQLLPTLPVRLKDELNANPFLQTNNTSYLKILCAHFDTKIETEESAFELLRKAKDNF